MEELQQRIDNATVGNEASSWGALKANFGN